MSILPIPLPVPVPPIPVDPFPINPSPPSTPTVSTATAQATVPPATSAWDQATWLVRRSMDAEAIGTVSLPAQVALPGAKAAITQDRLDAHQDAGHDQHTIVQRVNARFDNEHADRLAAHHEWAHGSYHAEIVQMRKKAAEKAAAEARRAAAFERFLAEQESE